MGALFSFSVFTLELLIVLACQPVGLVGRMFSQNYVSFQAQRKCGLQAVLVPITNAYTEYIVTLTIMCVLRILHGRRV